MPITQHELASPEDELVTTADAARIIGVVPDTVRLWQRLGRILAAHRTPTGVHLYRRSDLEQFARERALRRSAGTLINGAE